MKKCNKWQMERSSITFKIQNGTYEKKVCKVVQVSGMQKTYEANTH